MPDFNESNVRHLLRRTEIVDRPDRVSELLDRASSIEEAVDDVMVAAGPVSALSVPDLETSRWDQALRLTEEWLGMMAESSRPFAERMAFFWHGHLCSELAKVNSVPAMHEQIELFRTGGLGTAQSPGTIDRLISEASVQTAMLRYLDNDRNFATSPNQNFARELMELFLLGVGNFTESDVEAATAAWTGHTFASEERTDYRFDGSKHETAAQSFMGRIVNNRAAPQDAGFDTIDVLLGSGPLGSGSVQVGVNAGRASSSVCAEFLTLKLWQEFGEATSGGIPAGVRKSASNALIGDGLSIRSWVRAMLVHDDFYRVEVKNGLVRQPADYAVSLMVATGNSSEEIALWAMRLAGQQVLSPPNVSGWRPNAYWVNASAMAARVKMAWETVWNLTARASWTTPEPSGGYDDRFVDLAYGRIERGWIEHPDRSSIEVVDHLLAVTGHSTHGVGADDGGTISQDLRQQLIQHLDKPEVRRWMRLDALTLLLGAPDMHLA